MLSLSVGLVGVIVLLGWVTDTVALKSILPAWASMKVNTAVCFVGCAIALWLSREEVKAPRARWVARVLAVGVMVIGLLTLVEYRWEVDLGIDQLIFRDGSSDAATHPGRMSVATAVSFGLIGLSLVGLDWVTKRGWRFALIPALLTGAVGLLAFTTYLYGVRSLYALAPFSSMAAHTALCFAALGTGIIYSRWGKGVLHILTSSGTGGRLARRMLPVAVCAPIIIGWLRLLGEQAGYYDFEFGLALFAVSNVLIFSVLIWITARWLNRTDAVQARLAAIVEFSDDAIIGKTLDGVVTSWNAAAERLFGYSQNEMIGQSIKRIIPLDRQHEESMIIGRIANGESVRHFRTVRLHKDGHAVDISVTVSPVRDAQGRVIGASKVARDISERLRIEAELVSGRNELEARVVQRTAELNESNEALKRNAALLAEAQRIARLGSWTFEIATGKVQWSEELFRIVGLDPAKAEPNYKEQAAMFTPDSWVRLQRTIDHTVATGESYEIELEVVLPGGGHRWTIARGEVVRGGAGAVERLSGTMQDVTELKHAQIELARASERMQLATKAGQFGVWDWNVTDNQLIWDETMYRLYGIRMEDFSGAYDAWSGSVHPKDREAAEAALAAGVVGEGDFDTTFRIIRPDGAVRHIEAVAVVHRGEDGKALHMVGINSDITERLEMEGELKANEALLREFVAHAPAAIAMLDREMRYLQVSDRWCVDYKVERDIIGRGHYELFPDVPDRWKDIHQRVLAGAVERCDEDPFPRSDGGMEWLQWEARPWRKADGGIGGLIFFTQVITARKMMELQLRDQKEQLERSNHDLEQFAYVASHDLQEPLRAVTGCVQILQRRYAGKLDTTADELIGHIVDGASRMQALIHDLLAYSRVGTQGKKFSFCESAEAYDQSMANLHAAIVESGAMITVGELPRVRADSSQLSQLFQNLIGNALKYRSERAPEIQVSAVLDGAMWLFSVRDNGIGIEPQYFERIFALFQRLHTREEYSGTGIGLALCKKIIERHGGRIWLESTHGQGSVFYFTLPSI